MAAPLSQKAAAAAKATRNQNQKAARANIGKYAGTVGLGKTPNAANPFTQYRNGGQTNKRHSLNVGIVAFVKKAVANKTACTVPLAIAAGKAHANHFCGPYDIQAAVLAGQITAKKV